MATKVDVLMRMKRKISLHFTGEYLMVRTLKANFYTESLSMTIKIKLLTETQGTFSLCIEQNEPYNRQLKILIYLLIFNLYT